MLACSKPVHSGHGDCTSGRFKAFPSLTTTFQIIFLSKILPDAIPAMGNSDTCLVTPPSPILATFEHVWFGSYTNLIRNIAMKWIFIQNGIYIIVGFINLWENVF